MDDYREPLPLETEPPLTDVPCPAEPEPAAPCPEAAVSLLRRSREPGWLGQVLLGCLYLALSVGTLLYYITGPALAYLHADCADSLLWSQVMVETGSVLAEDFHYAALLPFGSPLWMVPVLWIFGYGMTAQTVSMCLFALLFVAAAFSLFRAMGWRHASAGIGTLCLCMLLSGSVKLREIMWEHVIYYSLGLLFIMVLLNLCIRLMARMRRWSEGERDRKNVIVMAVYALLLLIMSIGCGTDGMQVLVISAVPVCGAVAAEAVFDKRPLLSRASWRKYLTAGVMAVGMVLGLVVLNALTKDGTISAGYENAFSGWAAMSEWKTHAEHFLNHYLTLFGIQMNGGERLFSAESVAIMLQLVIALMTLVCPLLLLCRYTRIRTRGTRLLLWAHLLLSAVILLGFICGNLSSANWRLVPMLGTGLLATLAYFRELWAGSTVEKRAATVLVAVVTVVSLLNSYTLLSMPRGVGDNQKYVTVARELELRGCTYGYATFWNAGNTTLLSDGAVTVINIEADRNGISRRLYQTRDCWFEGREGQQRYFLMLTEQEYQQVTASQEWATVSETLVPLEIFQCEGFRIVVYDQNPMSVF